MLQIFRIKHPQYHFIGIFVSLIMGPMNLVYSVERVPCEPPEQLKNLNQTLVSEMGKYNFEGTEQTTFYAYYFANGAYKSLETKFFQNFPSAYKTTFEAYVKSFGILDQKYQAAGDQSEKEVPKDLVNLWKFHRHILEQTLPILVDPHFFVGFQENLLGASLENISQVHAKLYNQDFSGTNLKACQGEAIRQQLGKTQLEPRPPGDYEIKLSPQVGPVPTITLPPVVGRGLGGKNFYTPIETITQDRAGNYITCQAEENGFNTCSEEGEVSKTTTLDSFEQDQRIRAFKVRQESWSKQRNYWLTRTGPVSAHYNDRIVEYFEVMLDGILQINALLEKSLEHTRIICSKQGIKNQCWTTGNNTIPKHIDTTVREYKTRAYITE